jgi:NADPH-dependent ferric siderophore reductase
MTGALRAAVPGKGPGAEALAVREIRDLLLRERGLDPRAFNLMGYGRRGRVLD